MLWTYNNSNFIDNMGDWRPRIPRSGKYEVSVFIPNNYANTTSAHYEIYHAGARNDVVINQSAYFNQWVSLGTYRFNGGTDDIVRLIDMTGEGNTSRWIGFDTVKWEARAGVPNAPDDLRPRDGAASAPAVNLTWRDNGMDDGNPSFDFRVTVWRVVNGQREAQIGQSDWRAVASRLWTAPGYGEYEWIVEAGNGIDRSAASAPARFVVPQPKPDAPSDLQAQAISPQSIELKWQDNSKIESGYEIEKKDANGVFVHCASVGADETFYADAGLNPNTAYTYRVRAFNGGGGSGTSNEASSTTLSHYALVSVFIEPGFVIGGASSTATVSLSGPALSGGSVISISSSDGNKAKVPTNVVIAKGQTSATFVVTSRPATSAGAVIITATYDGVSKAAALAIGLTPVASNQTVTTNEDTACPIKLSAKGADGDVLAYAIVTVPTHGTLSGTAPNLTYKPNADYNGLDSFRFRASNGRVSSNTATISITVNPVNDAPLTANGATATARNTSKSIALTATDVDGDALAYSVVSQPLHGTLTGTGASRTYKPANNYTGTDSFTFKVNDGKLDSNVAIVSITVR